MFDDFRGAGRDNFDRSFDLQYKLVDEGRVRPAVAIGLRDFIGTGLFSGEGTSIFPCSPLFRAGSAA
ncbi:MAG: hypothetical protein B7X55_13915 [Rhodobacterales bacterium 34-62-10]|nr:MAG: hypothetical protein B7X55_13915 [Rhodobacterales bacterium 34-62-10]